MFKKIIAHHDFITGKPKYNYSVSQRGRLTEDGHQMVLLFGMIGYLNNLFSIKNKNVSISTISYLPSYVGSGI